MWYSKTQQYLRQSFTRSGRGTMLMGKDSNNLTEVISVDGNGSQQSVLADSSGNKVAVTGNQLSVNDADANASLASILYDVSQILNGIGSGASAARTSTSAAYTLTTSLAPIGNGACKQITLINVSTNPTIQLQINSGATIYLEAGYTMTIPATDLNNISAKSTAGGENLGIIFST